MQIQLPVKRVQFVRLVLMGAKRKAVRPPLLAYLFDL